MLEIALRVNTSNKDIPLCVLCQNYFDNPDIYYTVLQKIFLKYTIDECDHLLCIFGR